VRAAGAERGFPAVAAVAFTPYAAGSALLPLAWAARARSWTGAAVAGGAGAVLALASLDRLGTPPGAPRPGPPAGGPRLRVASLNLLHGGADPASVVDLVRHRAVDVLLLVELTGPARERLCAAGLDTLLPHSAVLQGAPGRPSADAGVWSRDWAHGEVRPAAAVPGFFAQPSLRLTLPGAAPLEVSAAHSHPPMWAPAVSGQGLLERARTGTRQWEEDLTALGAPREDVVRVVGGDLNATPDHRALRDLLARGWVDAARAAGQGRRATWSPVHAPQPRLVLDHVLVDPRVSVVGFDVVPVPRTDHRALVVDLVLPAA
jgi:hypothetical protein